MKKLMQPIDNFDLSKNSIDSKNKSRQIERDYVFRIRT